MSQKIRTMTGLSFLAAIVVVLQMMGSFIKFGPFSIALVFVPIVVGAAVYGVRGGALLGGVFSIIVAVASILGWDAGGNILWNSNPLLTLLVIFAKGITAGLLAGLFFQLGRRKSTIFGVVLAAIACQLTNSAIFVTGMYLFFYDFLAAWATGTGASIITYVLTIIVGGNAIVELIISMILSPTIVRIVEMRGGLAAY